VKTYTIASELKEGDVYRVKIKATVDANAIADNLDQIFKAKPRVIVMIAEQNVGGKSMAYWWGNNGFSSEQSADGVSIFNSAHVLKGGGTARNIPVAAADLTANSLETALIDMSTQTKVDAGQLVAPPQSLILVVPPALEFQAERIINSTLRPGVADNDINALKGGRKWKIVVNEFLTDDDAWFLQDANLKNLGLVSYSRVPVGMEPRMTDARTGNRLYPVRWRRSFGCDKWQGVFGNTGA
jgi:hypothetical protein